MLSFMHVHKLFIMNVAWVLDFLCCHHNVCVSQMQNWYLTSILCCHHKVCCYCSEMRYHMVCVCGMQNWCLARGGFLGRCLIFLARQRSPVSECSHTYRVKFPSQSTIYKQKLIKNLISFYTSFMSQNKFLLLEFYVKIISYHTSFISRNNFFLHEFYN